MFQRIRKPIEMQRRRGGIWQTLWKLENLIISLRYILHHHGSAFNKKAV
jgi:hypothetical protein